MKGPRPLHFSMVWPEMDASGPLAGLSDPLAELEVADFGLLVATWRQLLDLWALEWPNNLKPPSPPT